MISYIANIFPVATNDNYIQISNLEIESPYSILSLSMNYAITRSNARGQIMLVPNVNDLWKNKVVIDGVNKIKCGQIIQLIKLDGEDSSNVYLGYIEKIKYNVSVNGFTILITFAQILNQYMLLPASQNSIQASDNGVVLPSIVANKASLDSITNGSINDSLLELASQDALFNTANQPFIIASECPEQVFVYGDITTSRDALIRTALNPFQLVMYQQEDGNINIRALSLSDVNGDWLIEDGDYLELNVEDSSGLTVNKITNYWVIPPQLATLAPAPTKSDDLVFIATLNPDYFPRENELLNSGYFAYSLVSGNTLDDSVLQNVTLTDYLTGDNTTSSNIQMVNGTEVSLPEAFAKQELAQMSTQSHIVTLTLPLVGKFEMLKLPLCQLIPFSVTNDILDSDSYLCVGATVSWDVDNGSMVNLELVNPLTVCGTWLND